MSSSLSNVHKFWTRCIFGTASLRNRCVNRPSLFYTEEGRLVLDARSMEPGSTELVNAIVFACDLIGADYGFTRGLLVGEDNLFVWKKGGAA